MAFKVRSPQCQLLLLNTCYYYSNNTSLPAAKRHFSFQLFISELLDRHWTNKTIHEWKLNCRREMWEHREKSWLTELCLPKKIHANDFVEMQIYTVKTKKLKKRKISRLLTTLDFWVLYKPLFTLFSRIYSIIF